MFSGRVIRSLQRQSSLRLRQDSSRVIRYQSSGALDPATATYVNDLYHAWRSDPASVHQSWDEYFRNNNYEYLEIPVAGGSDNTYEVEQHRLAVRSQQLVRAYRVFGHYNAKIDPLGLKERPRRPELELAANGLTEADLDKLVPTLDSKTSLIGYGCLEESYTLRDLIKNLEASYCGSMCKTLCTPD